jgi:hypothetical protein
MNIKLLLPLFGLTVFAAPALAQGFDNVAVIRGDQMTDVPSTRDNVTLTGSFLRPSTGYVGSDGHWHVGSADKSAPPRLR